MAKKGIIFVIVIIILLVIGVILFRTDDNTAIAPTDTTNTATTTPTPGTDNNIKDLGDVQVNALDFNAVASPMQISGKAKGTWYFEASFPVKLVDANGKVLAQAPAQAQDDWMTTEFVPFAVTLTFSKPTTNTGTLIFEKDNPSGLPQNDKSVSIPVRFNESVAKTQTVKLYYQNTALSGLDVCDPKSVRSIDTVIPLSKTPIKDTLSLLLKNTLNANQKNQGFASEFPLQGVEVKSVNLKNDGTLVIEMNDPMNKTGGGSCRVGILRAQIEQTAKQFSGVKSVTIVPEELFQP